LTRFTVATREELWSDGRLLERRLSHGEAVDSEEGIVATDARDEALVAACDSAMEELRALVLPAGRTRLIAEATPDGVTRTITVTLDRHSIVTSPEHLGEDVALLRAVLERGAPRRPLTTDDRTLPMLWKNGTAAVLLHEAIGHPLEHAHERLPLPPWLTVDVPLAPRRSTFRDVPLLRMRHVAARQHDAPFAPPPDRIDILLIDGGGYEPLTNSVTIRVAAADRVRDGEPHPLEPFELTCSRDAIAFTGAAGDPVRYPGVVCSREGQELVVGSFAPLLLTEVR
jgi:hypothetical protein